MHIAAVMAALDIEDDLDPIAKSVLVAVCCRANQHTGAAIVSMARLAADVGRHRNTVTRALDRLVEKGLLSVDRRLGKTSIVRFDLHQPVTRPAPAGDEPAPELAARRIKKEKREGERALARVGKTGGGSWSADLPPNPWLLDEETGTVNRNPILDPANIAECVYCDDHGHLWEEDLPVAQCTHRPRDFTIDDILNTPPEQL